jgi:hypothetical protein
LLQIAHEGTPLEAPILLELADKIPAIIAEPLQELFRRIPRVEEDKLGLTAQAIACIAQQLQGQIELGGTSFMPEPKGQRNANLPVRPDQQDDGDAKDDFALFT